MRFEFATATRIIFGPGTISEAASLSGEMGKRAFVVTGSSVERAEPLLERIGKQGADYVTFNVPGEPTTIEDRSCLVSMSQIRGSLTANDVAMLSLSYE